MHHGIDEWSKGYRVTGRQSKGAEFSARNYANIYKKHLKLLSRWQAHTAQFAEENASVELRKDIFKKALYVVPLTLEDTQLNSSTLVCSLNAGVTVTVVDADSDEDTYADIFSRNSGVSCNR